MTTYETAVTELLASFPEFAAWDDLLDEDDLELDYVVYGRFAVYIQDIYKGHPRDDALLRRCLDFLESLAVTDDQLANLVEVGVLEMLGDLDRDETVRSGMVELLALMGPRTAYLFRHVEALWTGTLDEFDKHPSDEGLRDQWPPS